MKKIEFQIDYYYCPEGHKWTFIPPTCLYSDIFWCNDCDCFYQPTVKKVTRDELNKEFHRDRAQDLIDRAMFIAWKNGLNRSDYKEYEKRKSLI